MLEQSATETTRVELVALGVLAQAGINIAEATAGRYLRKLDRAGLTLPISTRGRVITEKGHRRLAELRLVQRQDKHSDQLVRAITATDVNEVIDLLYVRRAAEPEAARLAALRAASPGVARISAIDSASAEDWKQSETRVGATLAFHRSLARASHNQMLIAVTLMLLDDAHEPLARLLDRLTIPFDNGTTSSFALEHHAILEAITSHSPDEAESSMRAHIDHLIAAVHRHMARSSAQRDLVPAGFVPPAGVPDGLRSER
jgi:GntR family transcriptional regulator, transcriptional repressor for pyruvate dehydrogenase complex